MKTLIPKYLGVALTLSIYGMSAPLLARAQSLVYLSNTSQPVAGSTLTGSFSIAFTTGGNSSGYLLDSLTVLFANNSTPVLTSAELDDFSTITSFQNGVEVGGAGVYTFAPGSPLTLAANTPYALLFYTDDPQTDVNLSYTVSSAFTSAGNWNIPGLNGSDEPIFSITATPIAPVPEPSLAALMCVSVFALIAFSAKRAFSTLNSANGRGKLHS